MTRLLTLLSLSLALLLPAWNQAQACGGYGGEFGFRFGSDKGNLAEALSTYYATHWRDDVLVEVQIPNLAELQSAPVRTVFLRDGARYERIAFVERQGLGWEVRRTGAERLLPARIEQAERAAGERNDVATRRADRSRS